jgi:excisionase family DNA binding protein
VSAAQRADWITEAVASLPPLASASEASALLRCSPRQLRRLVAAGRLAGIRACETGSSRLLVPRASIERYLRGLDPARIDRDDRGGIRDR